MNVELSIRVDGSVRTIYSDDLDLASLGVALGSAPTISRASHVEPTVDGLWTADMGPSDGPVLGPFAKRNEALAAEVAWLRENSL